MKCTKQHVLNTFQQIRCNFCSVFYLLFSLNVNMQSSFISLSEIWLLSQMKTFKRWHNLDLYNNESLDKLVRRCAERFTLNTSYVSTAFAELINLFCWVNLFTPFIFNT
jgi:hypothetical protein